MINGLASLGMTRHAPIGVGEALLNLFDDRRFVVDHQNVERVIIALRFGNGLGAGFQVDDAADALDNNLFLERLNQIVPNTQLGDLEDVISARLRCEHNHRDTLEVGI